MGRRITIRGKAEVIVEFCTQAVCPPNNSCCNACSYQLGFRLDAHRYFIFSGANGGCSGNSCTPECAAMEPGKNCHVTGTLKIYGGSDDYLELEKWKSIR